jgi:tRNA (cytidine/uridine-2'-O-)-methyltransferase
MNLVLLEPDIPQNAGAVIRLGACLGAAVHIVAPCGFVLTDARLRRAHMDYIDHVPLTRHASWAAFHDAQRAAGGRLLLLTRHGDAAHCDWRFAADDWLLLGRESAGAPPAAHDAADARLFVPLRPGLRSLNVAMAAAIVLAEALRQTGGFATGAGS